MTTSATLRNRGTLSQQLGNLQERRGQTMKQICLISNQTSMMVLTAVIVSCVALTLLSEWQKRKVRDEYYNALSLLGIVVTRDQAEQIKAQLLELHRLQTKMLSYKGKK